MADIVLVPGLWLDASSWSDVVAALDGSEHRVHPVTLPGTVPPGGEPPGAVGLDDLVAHLTAIIDGIHDGTIDGIHAGTRDGAGGPVVLVGHSAACGVVHAAVDRRVERVAHAVHVGGFPSPAGEPIIGGFEPVDGGLHLPDWDVFDAADVADLDDAARARFRASAVVSPAAFATDPVALTDERRFDVPTTLVCPEYTAAQLQAWVDEGHDALAEVGRLTAAQLVDLPTGHWPQFTRPADLAALLRDVADVA